MTSLYFTEKKVNSYNSLLTILLQAEIKHCSIVTLSTGVNTTAAWTSRASTMASQQCKDITRDCLGSAWKCHDNVLKSLLCCNRKKILTAACLEILITRFSHCKISLANRFPCVAAEFSHPGSYQAPAWFQASSVAHNFHSGGRCCRGDPNQLGAIRPLFQS